VRIADLGVHAGFGIREVCFHLNSHIRASFAMVIPVLSARLHQGGRPILIDFYDIRTAIQCLLNRGNIAEHYSARQIVIGGGGVKTGNDGKRNDQNC
jgi:hypothetical protein